VTALTAAALTPAATGTLVVLAYLATAARAVCREARRRAVAEAEAQLDDRSWRLGQARLHARHEMEAACTEAAIARIYGDLPNPLRPRGIDVIRSWWPADPAGVVTPLALGIWRTR
jgi:hypothetical protein